MLTLDIAGTELFDESSNRFISQPGFTVTLEHSLVSLSKWESIWKIPFLSQEDLPQEQLLNYIDCMILSPDNVTNLFTRLTQDQMQLITDYISDTQSATTIHETSSGSHRKEVVTSEVIYYWMVALTIPFECQHWHINRLINLIRITNIKNAPESKTPKMSRAELSARNRELNAQRRAKYGTKG